MGYVADPRTGSRLIARTNAFYVDLFGSEIKLSNLAFRLTDLMPKTVYADVHEASLLYRLAAEKRTLRDGTIVWERAPPET